MVQAGATAAGGDIAALHRSALEAYSPASVLINADNIVVHFSSNAGKYLQIPGGELTHDLTWLMREPLRSQLLEGLRMVRERLMSWSSEPLCVSTPEGSCRIVLRLEPAAAAGLILVVLDDRDAAAWRAGPAATVANTIVALEAELEHLRGHLQDVVDGSLAGDEVPAVPLRTVEAAAELHSVLEELASSKEELQAVNEELITLDEENHRRVRELTQISTDLQHLLASTGIATLFLDRELHIVRFTPLLGELFGLRFSDIGRPVADMARLVRYEAFEADAHRVLEQSQSIDSEVMSPDGRWYLGRILPYRTEAGLIEGVVWTLIDITERKLAEQALQEASRHKDEFLAVLAHELRNPLAPISSGLEVLKTAPGDRRTVERIAATMARQTKQLVRLVDDLLEVSRIRGGKLRLRKSIIDLNDVIQDALASARPSIESAGHILEVDSAARPTPVDGDAARLTQVLSNLLSNAVRYTPQPGNISVRAAHKDGCAVVTVKDNGVGIAQEALEHVFEMFYQGLSARRGFSAGLGIGLTLAKTLVEMHGGTISAASAGENAGSEFTVRLPLAQPSLTTTGALVAREGDLTLNGDHRILIVDDNVDAAETLCLLMKSLGEREVRTASSGEQALKVAVELRPDIVLLDLMMPEMDGYEVARRIRSQPWGKDLLLVALSGWGHEDHRRRSKEAGFDRHVTKPADLAALRAVINGHHPPV